MLSVVKEKAMDDHDLDLVYTSLCQTMTVLGETQISLFLARFAMLAITRCGDAATAQQLIKAAATGLQERKKGYRLRPQPSPHA